MAETTPVRQRKYLAKDFDGLRAQILEYARLYYPDRIQDFSESSMGGLFLDMAAYVGDNMSFYLDHQFGELNPQTAVEQINIQTHLRNSGIPIVGTSPSTAEVEIYIQVPSSTTDRNKPDTRSLPIVEAGSVFTSNSGISFILTENVDFKGYSESEKRIGYQDSNGTILTYVISRKGVCVSGFETSETFSFGNFIPFRRISLSRPNVNEILSVTDDLGNIYYKVDALTNDVVYKNVMNTLSDNEFVKDSIKIVPAPFRYIAEVDLSSRTTSLVFGGGNAETFEDDIIPDPSEFSIPFKYSKTFDRVTINPKNLLQTRTLGVSSSNVTISVTYRYGGALSHNVPAGSIVNVSTLKMNFSDPPSAQVIANIRSSTEVINPKPATGGEDAPTVEELVSLVSSTRNSQERIVSKEDLLARIYTLPSNFGRVFRATVRPNQINPMSSQLFIVSRDSNNKLIVSSDSLKRNIVKYLDPYRLISDAIDVLDAKIINLYFEYEVTADPTLNKNILGQQISKKLSKLFDIKNFHIDLPINKSEIYTSIFSVQGIMSIDKLEFKVRGTSDNAGTARVYSSNSYDIEKYTIRNSIIVPPPGGIFEIKYFEYDVKGVIR